MCRWLKFNAVGMMGAGWQLASLWIFSRIIGIGDAAATLCAVEISILHNFLWHQRWTWRDSAPESWPQRLVRFHLGNGIISLLANPLLTPLFEKAGLPLLAANLAAIASISLVNFGIASTSVFRGH